ncbi:hypothetical protein SAY87_027639 [Trapa incisa]|uniref:Uncharacterized protein n=1 Tax=Trapa incisa TaxID=236973 RepID=A0AAN7JMX7_9MYRT|nr:hypothetical protein SAY87_027639 [Trapa incisa]
MGSIGDKFGGDECTPALHPPRDEVLVESNEVPATHSCVDLWFDQNCCRGRLVNRMLDSSDLIISILADEASMYLACLSIKYYPIEFDHH